MRTARQALSLLAIAAATPVVVALVAAGAPRPARGAAAPPAPTGAQSAPPAAGAGATEPRSEGFGERVLVREIEVVVELPDSVPNRKSLGPQSFQVLEDGSLRQVVKATPVTAGDPAPWQVVLYFDRVLARPATVFFTANSLAQHADQLTALGSVDVVVADPRRRVLLSGCREPRVLEQTLTDLAAQAERQRQAEAAAGTSKVPAPAGDSAGQGAAISAGDVRRQEDRLVSLVAARPGGGPRALVLVANGFDTSRSGGDATSATAAVAEEPARTLAAYGWVTIAAPMVRQQLGVEHREMTNLERMRQYESGGAQPGSVTQPPEILPEGAPKTHLNYDGVLNLFVEPSSATLTAIASATAGTVVGYPAQLTSALTSLSKRWHLFYLAPDPEDGKPRPVEVRLLPGAKPLRAPVWRRSSTTEEVAASRLRNALDGGAEHDGLAVSAAVAPGAHPALRLSVGAFSIPDAQPAGPFRLSIAYEVPGTAVPMAQHRILSRADLGEHGWSETVALDPPPGAAKVGIEVEDLTHQIWGTAVTRLPGSAVPSNQ